MQQKHKFISVCVRGKASDIIVEFFFLKKFFPEETFSQEKLQRRIFFQETLHEKFFSRRNLRKKIVSRKYTLRYRPKNTARNERARCSIQEEKKGTEQEIRSETLPLVAARGTPSKTTQPQPQPPRVSMYIYIMYTTIHDKYTTIHYVCDYIVHTRHIYISEHYRL